MPEAERKHSGRLLYALVAVLALAQAGCLLALAGAAGGAAATGYFYCKGRLYRDYPNCLPDVYRAVQAALLDLHLPIFTEEAKDGKAFLVTKTTNGKKVRIYLNCLSSPIPADGTITRMAIRVGAFGDESVCVRIFEQTALRLGHPVPVAPAPPPGAPPVGAPVPLQQTGFQTNEPKVAPAPAGKEKTPN
ncbi:MAG TPA: DUF3568 family protein [Gemmataceae bacterium]|nr:DUF3568 family protein [Gemmataceae bacterium]